MFEVLSGGYYSHQWKTTRELIFKVKQRLCVNPFSTWKRWACGYGVEWVNHSPCMLVIPATGRQRLGVLKQDVTEASWWVKLGEPINFGFKWKTPPQYIKGKMAKEGSRHWLLAFTYTFIHMYQNTHAHTHSCKHTSASTNTHAKDTASQDMRMFVLVTFLLLR